MLIGVNEGYNGLDTPLEQGLSQGSSRVKIANETL